MWLFTDAADAFDRLVHENDVFLEQAGTEAAADYLKDDSLINTAKLAGLASFTPYILFPHLFPELSPTLSGWVMGSKRAGRDMGRMLSARLSSQARHSRQ